MSEVSFLFDEHIPSSVVEELEGRGVDVKTVYDIDLESTPDSKILEFAEQGSRAIVTQDSDFLELDGKQHSKIRSPEHTQRARELVRNIHPQLPQNRDTAHKT